jgi:cytochrome c556
VFARRRNTIRWTIDIEQENGMSRRILALALGAALGACYIGSALAQARPEVLVEMRHGAMLLQGKYMYSIVPMAMGKIPYDAAIVSRNVGYLDVLSQMPWDGFQPSTADVKSKALPAVFSDPAKFKAAQENFFAELAKLDTAVKTGNEATIKAAILETNNKGCNGCHDNFRAKER